MLCYNKFITIIIYFIIVSAFYYNVHCTYQAIKKYDGFSKRIYFYETSYRHNARIIAFTIIFLWIYLFLI